MLGPVQPLTGHKLSQPFCGWVESDDPRAVVDPSLKDDPSGHYDEEDVGDGKGKGKGDAAA